MNDTAYTHLYSQDYWPSMPVVEVELSAPGRVQTETLLTALIDSGSDGTLIPIDILEQVGARCVGDAQIRGILGDSRAVAVYLASLRIGPHTLPAVRVVAASEDAEIILGRNVLNQLVVTLNGPAGVIQIPTHINQ